MRGGGPAAGLWAVVPAKDTGAAKARLAGVLAADERRGLARAMLEDVLRAVTAAPGLAGALVVTADEAAAALARRFGARCVADAERAGQSAAVGAAARVLAGEGALGMLALPGDVPLATAAEIGEVVAAHGLRPPPAVTLVAARADAGTNALACSPVDAIPLRFADGDSLRLHRSEARARGIEPRVLDHLPGLGLDLDRPEDLLAFAARPSATRAYAYLEESGIVRRLHGGGGRGRPDGRAG